MLLASTAGCSGLRQELRCLQGSWRRHLSSWPTLDTCLLTLLLPRLLPRRLRCLAGL
jgi:hypothetical protein